MQKYSNFYITKITKTEKMSYVIDETARKLVVFKENYQTVKTLENASTFLLESWLATETVSQELVSVFKKLSAILQNPTIETEVNEKSAEFQQNAVNLGKFARWYKSAEETGELEAKKATIRQKATTLLLQCESIALTLSNNLEYYAQNKSSQLRIAAVENANKIEKSGLTLTNLLYAIGCYFMHFFSSSASFTPQQKDNQLGDTATQQNFENNQESLIKEEVAKMSSLHTVFKQITKLASEAKKCLEAEIKK